MAVGCGNCVGKLHSFVLLRNVVHIVTRCFKVLEAGDVTSLLQTVCSAIPERHLATWQGCEETLDLLGGDLRFKVPALTSVRCHTVYSVRQVALCLVP